MEIKMLVMDVDGTLTDGKIYMSANGELMKAFNIKDGYAIAHLREYGIEPCIITGRESEIVRQRCVELKIKELYQGVSNKLFKLKEVCSKKGIELSNVAYIGDDVNDLACIQQCGCTACPSDAVKAVKEKVNYVCAEKGGEGAVRDFCEYLIAQQSTDEEPHGFELNEINYELKPYIND